VTLTMHDASTDPACRRCGSLDIQTTLLTSYARYCRCRTCGYLWNQPAARPAAQEPERAFQPRNDILLGLRTDFSLMPSRGEEGC